MSRLKSGQMTREQRSSAMKRVKLRNGPLEMSLRRALTKRGLRYRCNARSLPGSPDIVFPKQRVAVFVDGDFWHGWRLPAWEHKLSPFWRNKLRENRIRDDRNFRRLRARGWHVLRIWQHDIKNGVENSVARIEEALGTNTGSKFNRHMTR
jgi:DNA mismatch endonuclease (patch repair protein)